MVKLRLSVWRDYAPSRQLLLLDESERGHRLVSSESNLQQEIYVWQTREDPFAGIADDAARHKLRDLLMDGFADIKPPYERRFEAMHSFFAEAQMLIDSGGAEWTVSQEAAEDDEHPARLNTLLSLKNHLEWLHRIFVNQPGISVLVR